MAKFHGKVGYVLTEETAPGVFAEVITERDYYGDILRDVRSLEKGEQLNDNLTINNRFSLVGDTYAYENFGAIKYIKWMNGVAWKVSSVEIQRPRLILSVGGVYNLPPAPVEPDPEEPEVP